ncbi:hypothetical protein PG993_005958 [Apiospora rasikravindrae]|uniref:GED domain-containing protein n=1 Tax=Apiospora rasikravindrae TaxID=990691 RepID=A0ABR1TA92_9PEZI
MSPPTNPNTTEPAVSSSTCYVGKCISFMRSSDDYTYYDSSKSVACDDQSPGHVQRHHRAVMEGIQREQGRCKTELDQLGGPRPSLKEQRAYLVDISKKFTELLKDALRDDYSGPFVPGRMGIRMGRTRDKVPLRTVISEHLKNLPKHISDPEYAQRVYIYDEETKSTGTKDTIACIALEHALSKDSRACEGSGVTDRIIVRALLKRNIRCWVAIIKKDISDLRQAVRSAITRISDHLVGLGIADSVDHLVETVRVQHQDAIRQRITAFLGEESVVSGTYRGSFEVEKLAECFLGDNGSSQPNVNNSYATYLATDVVENHCKVVVEKFLVDYAANAERCIITKLTAAFNPAVVAGLPDEMIHEIASERQDTIQYRQDLQKEMGVLRKTEELLCQFQHESGGLNA